MRSLKLPISFQGGRVATTSNIETIVKQKIIDVLVTSRGERVMNMGYGSGAYSYLYEPMDPLIFADFKQEAISDLHRNVSGVEIMNINIGVPSSLYDGENTTVTVTVSYRIPPMQVTSMTFNISEFLTEDSFL